MVNKYLTSPFCKFSSKKSCLFETHFTIRRFYLPLGMHISFLLFLQAKQVYILHLNEFNLREKGFLSNERVGKVVQI